MAEHVDSTATEVTNAGTDTPSTGGGVGSDTIDEELANSPSEETVVGERAEDRDKTGESSDPAEREGLSTEATAPRQKRQVSAPAVALATGVAMLLAVSVLAGWLGYQTHQSRQEDQLRQLFVQTARHGALNLTTIDYQHVDVDVQRVLDSATGVFRDDFATRSPSFVEVVKKLQSNSIGTVTEAGLESSSGDTAQVLVTLSVKTTLLNQPDDSPRSWRMRLSVQKTASDQAKISNVVFVP